jgi:hypothetical protein
MPSHTIPCEDSTSTEPMAYNPSRKLIPDLSTYPIPPDPKSGDPGVEQWVVNMWDGQGMTFYQAGDTWETHRQAINVATDLVAKSERGDLNELRTTINQLRTQPPYDRPLFWLVINSDDRIWKGAYEAGHWYVIKYFVRDLGFSLTSTLPSSWYLPEAVTERAALETGSIEEMQRLLDLGWDINVMPGKSLYNYRNRMYFPSGGPLGLSTFRLVSQS